MSDEVPVLVDDLNTIRESLNAAYYKSMSEDLVDTYRTLNRRQSIAPLTKDLERTIQKVDAYLEEAKGDDEQGEEG